MKKLLLITALLSFAIVALGQEGNDTSSHGIDYGVTMNQQRTFHLVARGDYADAYLPVVIEITGMNATARVEKPITVEKNFPTGYLVPVYAGDTLWLDVETEFSWSQWSEIGQRSFYAYNEKERAIRIDSIPAYVSLASYTIKMFFCSLILSGLLGFFLSSFMKSKNVGLFFVFLMIITFAFALSIIFFAKNSIDGFFLDSSVLMPVLLISLSLFIMAYAIGIFFGKKVFVFKEKKVQPSLS